VERKVFLAMLSAFPVMGCTRSVHLAEEGYVEQESLILTRDDFNNLLDVFAGVWFAQDKAITALKMRDRLWRKLLTFTDPENQERFKDAYLDDFLENLPLIAYKYFIKHSDVSPDDFPRLKEMVKESIR
jgi:hypothetical protein